MKKILKKEKPAIIKQENPVYLKLEHDEAIDSKRDLLITESSLLKILKIIKKYSLLRAEGLRLKLEMYKAIKDLNASVKRTKSTFPFLQIPEGIRRKEVIKIESFEEIKPIEEIFDENLESQLAKIQEKLRVLSE